MKNNYLTIFTNDSDIENKIKIFAMTIFISIKKTSIIKKKQTYIKSFTKRTIYFEKFIKLELTLKIINTQQFSIIIFIDNQAAIKIIKFSKQ